jgi:beta-1,4-mannosyl-glycoprotein beta-1,4-N-acetylglucosaminyltransferase
MLEIRVRTLASVVDHFVIVESNLTFSGQPKPLYLNLGVSFRVCIATLHANASRSWGNEAVTRETILNSIADAGPSDWIIFSDLDGIPLATATCCAAA